MRFYLTTAIDYVNSRPHLGTAYEKISADVIARYKRMQGCETRFLMGNDEHSQNVFRRARELGQEPLAYCDRMEALFREVWARLSISFDDFIRTTEPRHRAAVRLLVERCAAAGDVYEGEYEGWYCVSCEEFKQDKDLVEGNCPVHGTRPDWIRERNHFFRLSRYQEPLLAHYAAHPGFVQPETRRNEMLRFLEAGLQDISISRAGQAWGISMPGDERSVVYVWFDALINYISAVGYGTDEALTATWWPADLHIVGKDITRFHCIVWPAMLMSAGLALPRQVFGHGWVHFRGQKMSKSLGTAVDPLEAADRLGPDPLRLFLIREIPYGGDGDFSWDRFEERYNVDLANNLGNLVSRVTAMTDRYRQGGLPASTRGSSPLAARAGEAWQRYEAAMSRLALHEAAAEAFALVDATNEFIASSEPWTLAKDPARADALDQVLYDAVEALRVSTVLLAPVMPSSAAQILTRLGDHRAVTDWRFASDARWRNDRPVTVTKGPSLWPRLEPADEAALVVDTGGHSRETHVDNPAAGAPHPPAPPGSDSDRIGIDDFMKVELRVARVLEAERVPKSRKLLRLRVDAGVEHRTLVAGIAEAYEPEALVGRTVVIVFNLKPATLMGIESNGMVLAASTEGGRPELVSFADPPPPGTRVR
jgi:methionyl-tRNA synthetase